MIITDNGREFSNTLVKEWIQDKNIKHKLTIPYYHKSNGRVERANRTIRNAIRKSRGPVKIILKRVIDNYNNLVHRGIGMTPNKATVKENYAKVLENSKKYSEEFKRIHKEKINKLKLGDEVFIRNEGRTKKMDDFFKDKGTVIEKEYGDVYKVVRLDGKIVRKHDSQLKKVGRGKLDHQMIDPKSGSSVIGSAVTNHEEEKL